MLLHSLVSHLARVTLTTRKSWLAMLKTWTTYLCNVEHVFFVHIVSLLWNVLGSNTTAGCLTVLAFCFLFAILHFVFPLFMLHFCLQLSTIQVFIFIFHLLYFDTGYASAKILLTIQYFWCLHCHLYHTCLAMVWLTRHVSSSLQWDLRVWVELAFFFKDEKNGITASPHNN